MKRYTTREQILKDIDRAHAKVKKLEAQAQEQLDAESLLAGTDAVAEKRKHGEAADKLLRKIKYQKERRLPKLGAKLAEMDTRVLV